VAECSSSFEVKTLKASDFKFEVAKNQLLSLNLPHVPKTATPQEKLLHYSSFIDFDKPQMVLMSRSCLPNRFVLPEPWFSS
jgi:hypothetical protein